MENMQSTVEDKLFIYKPLQDDPIDRNLANYINKAPLRLRSKMHFEREAPGIYRFARKKVFRELYFLFPYAVYPRPALYGEEAGFELQCAAGLAIGARGIPLDLLPASCARLLPTQN